MSSTCVQCALAWPSLNIALQTELAMNTHTIITDVHQNVLKICEDVGSQNQVVSDAYVLTSSIMY